MAEITKDQIAEWKKQHGQIFKITPIEGLDVIYRPLKREDYIGIMNGQMSGEIVDPEIDTVKTCVLNDIPDIVYQEKGGLATVVYEEIMKKSGFVIVESEEL